MRALRHVSALGIVAAAAFCASLTSYEARARTAGEIGPLGEGYVPDASLKSTRTRAEVRAETLAALAAKTLTPAGQEDGTLADRGFTSPLTREERKSRTRADVKAHRLAPAGQG
jgi:hypothetical protein